MFNKNKSSEKKVKFKAEKKTKGYDEFYKPRLNKKKLFTTIGLAVTTILLIVIAIVAVIFFQKINKPPETPDTPIVLSEDEKYYNSIKSSLSNDFIIGTSTKEEISALNTATQEKSGENFIIKDGYTTINNIDYFTTYLFKEDLLVGIVHEAMIDTSTKYSLATKFQNIASELNRAYTNIEISRRWFTEPVKYDTDTWNELIIDNQLELIAELAKGSEFIKVISSGIPYFDYLYDNKYDQNFGNLVIIYSNGANQDLFKQIDEIEFT